MTSEYLIASARLAYTAAGALQLSPAHAGERDMGLWAVEWVALPEALVLTASVASKLRWILDGLEVDTARMRSNVDLTQGAIMAEAVMMDMARRWGHEGAHRIVARASTRAAAEGLALDAALALDPEVAAVYPADELARLVSDPGSYLGTPDGVAPPSDP
jgi:3-carboxy-cis,cis-muconate cycloisomerase